jgi:hypothetical protein
MTEDRLFFEVGSITFQRDFAAFPENYSADDYTADIKALLESVPTVSDVEVEGVSAFKVPSGDNWTGLMAVVRGPVAIKAHYFLSPHPSRGTVSFRIRIPERIQEELFEPMRSFGAPRQVRGEEFEIVVHFNGHWPVAFIRSLDRGDHSVHANFIVREFLKRELQKRNEESDLRLKFIGPSPFHGEFLLLRKESDVGGDPVSVHRVTNLHGYDRTVVTFDPKVYPTMNHAYSAVQEASVEEFGLYYSLSRYGESVGAEWREIAQHRSEVVSIAQAKGVKAFFGRMFQLGPRTRDLSLSLFDIESRTTYQRYLVERALQEVTSKEWPMLIAPDLSNELEEAFRPRDTRAADVVRYVEGRRANEVNVLVVLVAAAVGFFGGIGGALLAAAVQGGG